MRCTYYLLAQHQSTSDHKVPIHIVVRPESYNDPDPDTETPSRFDIGSVLDGQGSAKTNGHFFEEALLRARETEAPGAPSEVKVVGNGHCHVTDRCRRVTSVAVIAVYREGGFDSFEFSGVWMCFGGGGSYSGYGKIG